MAYQYNFQLEANAMYAYIVQGYSSTEINKRVPGLFEQISERYNLNYNDKGNGGREGYHSGQHRGKYKNGYHDPETGQIHTVTLDIIAEYMKSYQSGYCSDLEDFLSNRFQSEEDEFYDEDDEYYDEKGYKQPSVQPKQQVYSQPSRSSYSQPNRSSYSQPRERPSFSPPVGRGSSSGFSFAGVVVFIIVIAIFAGGMKSCSSDSDLLSNLSSAFSFEALTDKKSIKIDASPMGYFENSKKCTIDIDNGEKETEFLAVIGTEFRVSLSKGTHTICIRSEFQQSDIYDITIDDDTTELKLYYYEDEYSKLHLAA